MLSLMMLSFFATNQSTCSSDDDMNKKAAEIADYIIKKMSEKSADIIAGIAVGAGTAICATFVYTTSTIPSNIYGWMYPSAEQIASAKEASERVIYLDAKTNFRKCLADPTKSKSEKNIDGVPADCEKEVSAFVICGGYHEAIQMTSDFGRTK